MNKSSKKFCFCKNCSSWESANGKWGTCPILSDNENGTTYVEIRNIGNDKTIDPNLAGLDISFQTFENFGCIFGKEKISLKDNTKLKKSHELECKCDKCQDGRWYRDKNGNLHEIKIK